MCTDAYIEVYLKKVFLHEHPYYHIMVSVGPSDTENKVEKVTTYGGVIPFVRYKELPIRITQYQTNVSARVYRINLGEDGYEGLWHDTIPASDVSTAEGVQEYIREWLYTALDLFEMSSYVSGLLQEGISLFEIDCNFNIVFDEINNLHELMIRLKALRTQREKTDETWARYEKI